MSIPVKMVLLLGGTAEARALADAFDVPGVRLVASLAGATAAPRAYPCEMRIGGFGGAEGLSAYMNDTGTVALVDATHPFAVRISRNAFEACVARSIPRLALVRPHWSPVGDWRAFVTLEQAIAALPSRARVLATTGRQDIAPWLARTDLTVFLRSVDDPGGLPLHIVPLVARGPFTVETEVATMKHHGITHLVTRNAGGAARARLDAAVALGLPLHIVERPPAPLAPRVHSAMDSLRWLDAILRQRDICPLK